MTPQAQQVNDSSGRPAPSRLRMITTTRRESPGQRHPLLSTGRQRPKQPTQTAIKPHSAEWTVPDRALGADAGGRYRLDPAPEPSITGLGFPTPPDRPAPDLRPST